MIFQGCSSTSKIAFFEEKFNSDQEALVYVYRLKSMVGALVTWNVNLDDAGRCLSKAGRLHGPARLSGPARRQDRGITHPRSKRSARFIAQNPEAFMAKPRETYFVRSGGFGVEFAAKEKAMAELPAMKYEASRQAH